MTEPTDAELWQLYMTLPGVGPTTYADPIDFARAILEKWGMPPAVEGEQFKVVSKLGDACLFHSSSVRKGDFIYTTPQPAQTGAVPLTCEWTHNEDDGFWETACGEAWRFDDGGPKENNMNFCHCCGKSLRIKGGQHG